ncbi:hypothetical protein DL93DRAFT_2229074 [Clavulina sp. PMI_390]|nr:hypothetical protein DL93DRAFT_2229074 [Clavulina sp. PMI_390]
MDTIYYLTLAHLLLSSGDIDVTHVAKASPRDIHKRWDQLIKQMTPTIKGPPSSAICRRLASWIRFDAVSKITIELEYRNPWVESNLRAAPTELLNLIKVWWDLFHLLFDIAMAVPRCHLDPSVSSALQDMISSAVALRLVALFQNLDPFNSPYDPETPIEFRAPSASAASQPSLNREVHESAIRLAILSRHRILPHMQRNATRLFELSSIPEVLNTTSEMFSDAIDAVTDLQPAEARGVSFSQLSGLTPGMLLEQSLDIADACSGNQKALGYKMVSRMFIGGNLEEMQDPASASHYIRRSIAFSKEPWFLTSALEQGDTTSDSYITLTQLYFSWSVLATSGLIGLLDEIVVGGAMFVIERFSLTWSASPDMLRGLSATLNGIESSLVKDSVGSALDFMRQCAVIEGRMQQSDQASPDIREAWKRTFPPGFVGSGPYCSQPGCESLEPAGLRCGGCGKRFYCSKECQKASVPEPSHDMKRPKELL